MAAHVGIVRMRRHLTSPPLDIKKNKGKEMIITSAVFFSPSIILTLEICLNKFNKSKMGLSLKIN